MNKSVLIIGGGIAGMQAAITLANSGIHVTLLEKTDALGGHLSRWNTLFPNHRKSEEVIGFLQEQVNDGIEILLNANITGIVRTDQTFSVRIEGREEIRGDALLLATGFDLFDCRKKEEYGYGIYDNVLTSADVEDLFRSGNLLTISGGKQPKKIGIIHCVGSRDEKAGNLYCSKVCCITGVKQGIGIRQKMPGTEIFCFYMDLRMFDRHFEEMYLEAQQKWGIHFIRGRLSEASENADRTIVLKVEDTLAGLPLKLTVDLVILLAGFVPSGETVRLASMLGLTGGDDGFLNPEDEHILVNHTTIPGLFLAGAVKGPVTVQSTIADAQTAALTIEKYLYRHS
jgi:heterodisulfide reductase subunit A2